jgi:hypothetical protein
MGVNDVRMEFLNTSLDRSLCAPPGRDRNDTYPVRDCIHDGRTESAPMRATHDQRDLMLSGLKAGKFRSIALGSREAAGKDDVHDAHRLYWLRGPDATFQWLFYT